MQRRHCSSAPFAPTWLAAVAFIIWFVDGKRPHHPSHRVNLLSLSKRVSLGERPLYYLGFKAKAVRYYLRFANIVTELQQMMKESMLH
jgi:hypothetical protein